MKNLVLESYYLSGARDMLLRLLDEYNLTFKVKVDKDDKVYVKAEIEEILSSKDATRKFLEGNKGGYYGWCRDKKGRLVSAKFMFTSSRRDEERLRELQGRK